MKCIHLRTGELAKHVTVRFENVDEADATTTYRWRGNVELCVFCAGRLATVFSQLGVDESPMIDLRAEPA